MLFPNILDPKCFSQSMQPAPQPHEQAHHLSQLLHNTSKPEAVEPQPRRFSFARRHSTSKIPHADTQTYSEPDHEPEPIPSPHPRRASTSSSHVHIKTPELHIHDLALLLTQMIAPATFLYSPPTEKQYHDVNTANPCVIDSKCKGITRVDSLDVEEERREDEELDDCDGMPLCREAEIEKWKMNVPPQRWALY